MDAGNGAGGFYAEKVLLPLGADTTGSQFLEPDGRFPNHIPNPENETAMRSVCEAVKNSGADFGIIFDTDVDRAGAVDENGEEINRNRLIALISAILLAEKPGTIVTDSVTSDGLAQFIEAHGGKHCRFRRGYKTSSTKPSGATPRENIPRSPSRPAGTPHSKRTTSSTTALISSRGF